MKKSVAVDREALPSEEERVMLRDSIRGFLERYWSVDTALERAASPQQVKLIWRELAAQGLAALGSDPSEGGVREILVVMEELGRAACPAPMLDAALVNLALRSQSSDSPELANLLSALHQGEASVSFGFGAFDGDANAGSIAIEGGKLHGKLSFLEGIGSATHLIVVTQDARLVVVKASDPGIVVKATPGLAVPALSTVSFAASIVVSVPCSPEQLHDLNRIARLALVARSLGAARRAYDMVVEYAKERHQFGQPIGKFQAIQHKLANCLIGLEGVRLTLHHAAQSHDFGHEDWRFFASACYAFASTALRQVSLETHHTFGAIGYSEEHEAPRHFRRTHGDLVRHGGPLRARQEVAAYLLDEGRPMPEYDLGAAGNAFRSEVRSWLQQHWVEDAKKRHDALPFEQRGYSFRDPVFHPKLADTGWFTAAWPKSAGGQGRSPLEQLAMAEEIQRVDAPSVTSGEIPAFALMRFGTPEQKAKFLPLLARGEVRFCLGYSEPGSGSDLASLKTSAVRDGEQWVINGQKLWTTGAEKADYMWLAARTDPQAKPQHAGISVFIVPMNTPGVTLRPSMALYGHTFCSEFFDDVRIPAANLVGELNGGWKVITAALATERIMMGAFVSAATQRFEQVLRYLRQDRNGGDAGLARDRLVRDRIGMLAAEIEVARQFLTDSIVMLEGGKLPVHEAAMSKVYTGELMQRIGESALELCGQGATLSEGAEEAITEGRLEQMLRQSIMMVVGGGSAEVQRNLIALRGLNLPR